MAGALVFGRWILFFNSKGTPSWTLQKTFCCNLSLKLLVLWERIDEA
jgi:hypothetical protein